MADFLLAGMGITLAEGIKGECQEAARVSFGAGGDCFSGFESQPLKAFVISPSPRSCS